MFNSWNVRLGSLWRTYKVQASRAAPFVKEGTLTQTDHGLELIARYDPPGSGWMAAGAALVTGIIVVIAAQALGSCAGPGWLLWFLGIALLRRRTVTLNVQEADRAIIDPANRRLAFHVEFEGKPRWVALDVPQDFEAAGQAVAAQLQGRVFQDKIERALTSGSIALIVLASLFVAMILFSLLAVFVFMARAPRNRVTPGIIGQIKIYGAALPLTLNSLTGWFRRT